MTIIKFADINFDIHQIHNFEQISKNAKDLLTNTESADIDPEIKNRFAKVAAQLKIVAPKASDFLYFSAVMMHAAEASVIDQETGNVLMGKSGKPVEVGWDVDKKGSWKWKTSDPDFKPYKNKNGDIFPEAELKKAYRKWIGRPLCKDHQSSSVDGVRGLIVDVYYDEKRKRLVALCALDRKNYPDLARKVETGYANDVSMGTGVGMSICTECGNIAKVESDYCDHVRTGMAYGEINVDLSPIELSLVVTGADPKAKLKSIIASLNRYSSEKEERIQELKKAGCVTPSELNRLEREVMDLKNTLQSMVKGKFAAIDSKEETEELHRLTWIIENSNDERLIEAAKKRQLDIIDAQQSEQKPIQVEPAQATMGGGYMNEPDHPTYQIPEDFDSRLASTINDQIIKMSIKLDAMDLALRNLAGVQKSNLQEDTVMTTKNQKQSKAYFQGGGGVNEPQEYPKDPMAEKVRDKEDKQMAAVVETGSEGMFPGDEQVKKMLSRAELEERKMRRHALLSKKADSWSEVGKTPDGKSVLYNASTKETKAMNAEDAAMLMADDGDEDDVLSSYVKAYYQGGGGVNEPQEYPKDPMAEMVRNKQDKQMAAVVETGSDGLFPGDEQVKKMVHRAQLRAKLIVARNDDFSIDKTASHWDVYNGSEKVLEVSASESDWNKFATKDFGAKLIKDIRNKGLRKTADDLATPAPMPGMPGAPMAPEAPMLPEAPMAPEMPEPSVEAEPMDAIISELDEYLQSAEKALGDLKDVLEETGDAEAEAELPSPIEASAKESMTKLASNVKNVYDVLDQSADELALLSESLHSRLASKKSSKDPVTAELVRLAKDALIEHAELRKEANLILEAAKKVKKEEESEVPWKKGKGKKVEEEECEVPKGKKEKKEEKKEEKGKKKSKSELILDNILQARSEHRQKLSLAAEELEDVLEIEEDVHSDMDQKVMDLEERVAKLEKFMDELGGEKFVEEEKMEEEHSEMDLDDQLLQLLDEHALETTASERKAWRERVAAEYQLKLESEVGVDTDMPLGKSTTLTFDTKTPEAEVEGIVEVHQKIMKAVEQLPAVREAMSHIGSLLKAGKLKVSELEDGKKLTALAVDAEAAKYWKELWNQATDSDAKSFGTDMVKEYETKKVSASLDESKAKMRRAYDLALDMQDKGMIDDNPEALHKQVDSFMAFSDEAFESYKKAMSAVRTSRVKTASTMPAIQVGMSQEENVVESKPTNLASQLKKLW